MEFCNMDNNNIISAPQIADVDKYYRLWRKDHFGALSVFIDFMLTPSADREKFINSLNTRIIFTGSVASPTLI